MQSDRIEFSAMPDGNIRAERYLAGIKSARIYFDKTQLRAKDATKDWAIEANRLLNQPNADPIPPFSIVSFHPNSVFDRLERFERYGMPEQRKVIAVDWGFDDPLTVDWRFQPALAPLPESIEQLLTDAVERAEANVKTTDMPTL